MPHRSLNIQLAGGLEEVAGLGQARLRDIVWDRPIFRAPVLPNPRTIFDPLPFRTQIFTAARRLSRLAQR